MPTRRVTANTIKLALALMSEPFAIHYGYALSRESGLRSGAMYPALARMLKDGWLEDGWENPADLGRPPRRNYTVTDLGRAELGAVLRRAEADARPGPHPLRLGTA